MKSNYTKLLSKSIFRKFSRKKYAAFNSLYRVIHIGMLSVSYCFILNPLKVFAQTDTVLSSKVIDMQEVEIVGQKSPALFEELPRMVSIITQKELECAPSQSVSDVLRYTSSIDVRQRGKSGIQSDISIRGGTFDQTMILFNGTNISDPQTGHLDLLLPVDIDAISRIEILNGPDAQLYGANAFSGAVNFITKPSDSTAAKISFIYGEHGYVSASATLNLSNKRIKNLIYFNNSQSNGYVSNTDFNRKNFFFQSNVLLGSGLFDLQFGYSNRAFGANGFYSPKYPDQFEENTLTFGSISYKTGSKIKSQSKIYWRRHRDRFELFREGKNWYRIQDGITISNDTSRTAYDTVSWYSGHNHHINDEFGADMSFETKTALGSTAVGWHLRSENIMSTNIGYNTNISVPVRGYDSTYYTKSDNRTIFNLFAEQTISWKSIYLSGGASLDWNSYLPDVVHFLPGADLRIDLTKYLSAIASYNYTIGLPTFTDLHYYDQNNVGNLNLKPYSQNSLEAGFRLDYNANLVTVNGFYNIGKGIIDWVWFSDKNIYSPVNIDRTVARGFEFSGIHNFSRQFGNDFFLQNFRLHYTFIDLSKNIPGNISKYSNARNMLSAMLQFKILRSFILALNYSYLDRQGSYIGYDFASKNYTTNAFHPYWLMDARLTYSIKSFTVYAEATNLFNKKYVDVGSITQPGRWITAGVSIQLR